ncbi:glycoside hydrolase family 26 protein [Sorangium sp. So ce426]|uniref:glycoside hydrolase family 26 protein n=1 Tax=unclassified Sorangium TaxID=2621164 RepID=UPI003F5C0C21
MKRSHRAALAAAATTGAALAVLSSTYGRAPAELWLSSLFGTASAAVASAELSWIADPERDARLARVSAERASRQLSELRAPARLLYGAHDGGLPGDVGGYLALEEAVGQTLLLTQIYAAWGDGAEQRFPSRAARAIWAVGSVPVITWEPWLSAFQRPRLSLRPAATPDHGGLTDIAGGAYDAYIDSWAKAAAEHGHPILLRFAHEMNDGYRYPWGPVNNPDPREFIRAWRHVVGRFRAAGAGNVLWVWAPSVSYENYWEYYPGSAWVDWVATGVLNYGTAVRWSRWYSFQELFARHYERLAPLGKPLMIAELGTLAAGGDRARWYEEALTGFAERHPAVKALLFFHVASDATVTHEPLSWAFADDPAVAGAVRRALAAQENHAQEVQR